MAHRGLRVMLVGDGPVRDELVRLAYELEIADRVVICPSVDDTRVPLAFLQAFAAPAWREGFGLAIVEAMAAGVPVVATDAGGPAEIIEEGKSGLLVRPGDALALESALRTLLKNPDTRRRMAEQARLRAGERFDLERMVSQVEQVYARAVNTHG